MSKSANTQISKSANTQIGKSANTQTGKSQTPHPKSKIQNRKSKIVNPIVSIGDLVADLIVSIPTLPAEAGQHQVASDIQLEPGGGANFLIAGARLGYPMAAIGALGNDEWGHRVAEIITSEGVNLSGVKHGGTTTTVIVLVSKTGEHVFLGKYGHGGKISLSQPDVELIKRSGAIFCAGYTLCEERLVDLSLNAMQLAQQHGIPVYFDPGPQMAAVPLALRRTIIPLIDTLLLTEDELPLMSNGGSIAELMERGPGTVALKRGSAGCAIYADRQPTPVLESPGYPVPVLDTSAAGDSFDAAFIAASLRGYALEDCAKLANVVGAAKVQKIGGGRNVPTFEDVQNVITQFNIDLDLSSIHNS